MSPSDVYKQHNHTFKTIRFEPREEGYCPPIGEPSCPSVDCPCGNRIYVMSSLWDDDKVIECPRCKEWHVISFR